MTGGRFDMPTRPFGRTGIDMPLYSLGGMRFMASWKHDAAIPAASNRRVEAVIHRALERGVRHIDTARGYGTSERQIGRVLRHIARERYLVSTKVTPRVSGREFAEAVRDSIARLRCGYLDVLYVHGIDTDEHLEAALKPGGAVDAARDLRRNGLVGSVGFSAHAPLPLLVRTIESGRFDCAALHYYLLMPRNAPAVRLARRKRMGVAIISPTDKGGQLHRPSDRVRALAAPFEPMVLSDLFCLTTPGVQTVHIGAEEPGHLDGRLSGLDFLDEKDAVRTAASRIVDAMRQRLGCDYCTGCHRCEPCPEGLNIPETLRLRNLAVGLDLDAFARWRFNLFEQADHWFPGRRPEACTRCGDCLPRCPEQLDIPGLIFDTVARLKALPSRRLGRH